MTNMVGPERFREYKRLASSLSAALGLAVLASVAWAGPANATDHYCSVGAPFAPSVDEGGSVYVEVRATSRETETGGCQDVDFDLDDNPDYETQGRSMVPGVWHAHANIDGPAGRTVNVRGYAPYTCGASTCTDYAYASATVTVSNVAPTADFSHMVDEALTPGTSFGIFFWPGSAWDPSSADRDAGFTYGFDCDGDGVFEHSSTDMHASCTANNGLSQTVRGRVTDKDGGSTTYEATIPLNDTTAPTVIDDEGGLEPNRGAVRVSRNTDVSATFSEEMRADSLTASTFKLQVYNKKKKKWKTIPATIASENASGKTTATLDPYGATEGSSETPLPPDKKFRGKITTGATDLAGNPLARNFLWTFTTGSTR